MATPPTPPANSGLPICPATRCATNAEPQMMEIMKSVKSALRRIRGYMQCVVEKMYNGDQNNYTILPLRSFKRTQVAIYHPMKNTKTASSLWFPLIFYWLITGGLLLASLKHTSGHFGYPLDDTYIHMAIAKHFATEEIWGVAQNEFSSSTSSPLWTLLIAATYLVLGVNEWTPFILALVFGSLSIYFCHRLLVTDKDVLKTSLILSIVTFVPLPILTLTGMEHVLQSLVTLVLIYFAAEHLSKKKIEPRSFTVLLLFANLATITRYEGISLVFSITLMFAIKKRFLEGIVFGVASFLAIAIYGSISIANDWYFLPNSVILKVNIPTLSATGLAGFWERLTANLFNSPHILALLTINLYLWVKTSLEEKERVMLILVILITIAHMTFASTGWFFRYEAYIVLVSCFIIGRILLKYAFPQFSKHLQNQDNERHHYSAILLIGITFLGLFSLVARTAISFREYPLAVKNIFEQQYQMGLFMEKYYTGKCVAANDIGAINFLANICTIDLVGLANMEVATHKLNGSYDKRTIEQLVSSNDVQAIVIYDHWFTGRIPDSWIQVGAWKISNNVIAAGDTVFFYAPNNSLKAGVIENLANFSNILPPTVAQSGVYTLP